MRMPRVSVYLPTDLYDEVKRDGAPVSEILQEALRARSAVAERLRALDTYLDEMVAEVGPPTAANRRAADELIRQILAHDPVRSAEDLAGDDFDPEEMGLPPAPPRSRRRAARASAPAAPSTAARSRRAG